ncbi:MAG: pilus assembly protein TadG-related protein [Acidimicrobiia bacterium]
MHDDRGAAEVVASILIAPVVVAFVVLLFSVGRQVESRASVRTAADSAAQAAARQRDPGAADAAARRTAADMLGDSSTCTADPTVVVDVSDFRPGGIVTVDVTCNTRNDDLVAVAAPPRRFTGHGAAVIDTYRAGTP